MTVSDSAMAQLWETFRAFGGAGLIREAVELVLQELIEAEAAEAVGAGRYERSDARRTQRNGHRPRLLATQAGDVDLKYEQALRANRLRRLCVDASMAVEHSLKTLIALRGTPLERTHNIAKLADQAQPLTEAFRAAIEPLRKNTMRPDEDKDDFDDLTIWRVGASYPSEMPEIPSEMPETSLASTARLAPRLARAAVASADAAVDSVVEAGAGEDHASILRSRSRLRRVQEVLDAGDVVQGVPPPPAETSAGWFRRICGWLSRGRDKDSDKGRR